MSMYNSCRGRDDTLTLVQLGVNENFFSKSVQCKRIRVVVGLCCFRSGTLKWIRFKSYLRLCL